MRVLALVVLLSIVSSAFAQFNFTSTNTPCGTSVGNLPNSTWIEGTSSATTFDCYNIAYDDFDNLSGYVARVALKPTDYSNTNNPSLCAVLLDPIGIVLNATCLSSDLESDDLDAVCTNNWTAAFDSDDEFQVRVGCSNTSTTCVGIGYQVYLDWYTGDLNSCDNSITKEGISIWVWIGLAAGVIVLLVICLALSFVGFKVYKRRQVEHALKYEPDY
jgi:hypothetical protein